MLAVSPLRSCINDEREGEVETFSIGLDEFSCGNNLLDDIDFNDICFGIDDGDVLPDLEMDSDMLAEFSISGGEETSEMNVSVSNSKVEDNGIREEDDRGSGSGSGSGQVFNSSQGEEIVSKGDELVKVNSCSSSKQADNDRKSSRKSKGSHGRRKVKVDWTPELHRKFVQAVEQLGMDKAVPSRILELMGIDCLTRHNIASHLQKYRSHQKHLRAREAEAASWNHRRQIYGGKGGGSKRDLTPWIAPPTMGFPHPPPPPPTPLQPFRPLHVWGHPTIDQSVMHMWPKHLAHSPSAPRPPWAPPPPPPSPSLTPTAPPPLPPEPSYWHPHQQVPNVVTQGTPFLPQTMLTARFPNPPVPGIPHHAMYKGDQGLGVQPPPYPPFDFHPSKESIDAAIGDVLSKPWLPLPLGLKPPSLDSVMVELQRQGVPKIPPSHASS